MFGFNTEELMITDQTRIKRGVKEAGWVQKMLSREGKTIFQKKLDFLAGEANGSRQNKRQHLEARMLSRKKRESPTTLCCFSIEVL